MEIKTLASTSSDGRALNQGVIMDFSGKMAGICYMKETLDEIMHEPEERTLKRATNTLERKHHSVFGHESVTLYLEGIPKILAMVLNNEKYYNTSEKSARYTEMQTSGLEEELYFKWKEIFISEISLKYNGMDVKMMSKLAYENARYFISVFTPSTNMAYSTSVQQLNYIVGWMNDYVAEVLARKTRPSDFEMRLTSVFSEFVTKIDPNLLIPGLTDPKGRRLSLFATRDRAEEWGENYSTNYYGSFAQLAQVQRHRTLSYEFSFPDYEGTVKNNPGFYIPPLLYNGKYEKDWLTDAEKVFSNYPQGMMLKINERGTPENFILKCSERLCGQAQLETCAQTLSTLSRYYHATDNPEVAKYLEPYVNKPRCKSFEDICKRPCFWGPNQAFSRLV